MTHDPGTAPEVPGQERPQTSTRDPEDLRARLERWLATKLDAGASPRVLGVDVPASNGMSSETLLFDATWTEGGATQERALVARLAPDPNAVPVFPTYDLDLQFRLIGLVAEHSDVPVPRTLWSENDPTALGAPFFVMERVDGRVPPDLMPYPFGDNWVADATDEQRQLLEDSTVRVLAELHAIPDPTTTFAVLAPDAGDDRTPLRRHVDGQWDYYRWVVGDGTGPLLERAFKWLDDNWPEEGPTVLSWGDSRVGNVLYRDFAPVAVLDWEMAALAPREVDVGWLIFLHRFFQDLAEQLELPGLPQMLRRERVAEQYAAMSGYEPRDLDWFTLYAALRHAIVMTRIGYRSAHFGEAEMPEDPDDLIMHRATLEAMLDGTYWSSIRE